MADQPVFLDTNVYIGYALDQDLEVFHSDCCFVFDRYSGKRHTSYTVNQELNKKKANRKKIYRELDHQMSKNADLEAFYKEYGRELGINDVTHLRLLLHVLKTKPAAHTYLNSLYAMLDGGIRAGLAKTEQPLVECSSNGQMKDELLAMEFHDPDNCVIADYVEWVLRSQKAALLTTDPGIYKRCQDILAYVENSFVQDSSKLSIDSLKDFVHQLSG